MPLIDGNIVEKLAACFFTYLQNCRYGMVNPRIESSLLILLVSKATNERWSDREVPDQASDFSWKIRKSFEYWKMAWDGGGGIRAPS